jgi:5-methylcytosine-specific restriction endonuclease McrA
VETLIVIVAFAPLVLLIWALVRHAGRIRRDAIDKESRTERLDNLNPAIARFVLERDRHTCQRCGTTHQVGVDFRGATPSGEQEVTADDLEASCSRCFLGQWKTLQGTSGTDAERTGTRSKLW